MGSQGPNKAPSDAARDRRHRLEQLLRLALTYRDCSRKELARWLGRDPTKLVPGTGVPKLDVVVELATVLDWPVGDVVAHLWNLRSSRSIDRTATSRQRARGLLAEARSLCRDGYYLQVVDCATRGLREPDASTPMRRSLQVILGLAQYALGSVVEARALARDVLATGERPRTREDRVTLAAAHLLAGQADRRLLAIERRRPRLLATAARRAVEQARTLYRDLAQERHDTSAEGHAQTCVGALMELDVTLGRLRPTDAVARIATSLERARHASELATHRLESFGWWCIYGCNIALRHLADAGEMEHAMAVFTNKADEIANHLDHWSLRERVFTMQYTRWERAGFRFEMPRVIDSDDVRVIAGTMGRFPAFRETGWRILKTAQIVESRPGRAD